MFGVVLHKTQNIISWGMYKKIIYVLHYLSVSIS